MTERNDELQNPKKSKLEKFNICKKYLQYYVPITSWLPNYRWKQYFISDLVGGLTLGFLHVPQALAFAILANASPIMGLYTSCFPVFVYCFFGTAYISFFGPVALNSLLVGQVVNNYGDSGFTKDQMVAVITFLMGVYYLLAYILRFAVITRLFTKVLSSAFISGCAAQVIISSFKTVLGIRIANARGYFTAIFNAYNTFRNISATNFITLGLSIGILAVFTFNTFVIKPSMKKCTTFILPMEMLVMIIVILISFLLELHRHGVHVVGFIPTGIPMFALPEYKAILLLYFDTFFIFVVSCTAAMSLSLMVNPELRPDQELLALGIANTTCCTLHTMPLSNSMMRSVIARSCGVRTLLSSIISSILIMMVILFMGPLFHPLPECVLGCIILHGLTILLVQTLRDLPQTIKSGKENTVIWFSTALSTLFISIIIGLAIGFVLSLRQFLVNFKESKERNSEPVQPEVSSPRHSVVTRKR